MWTKYLQRRSDLNSFGIVPEKFKSISESYNIKIAVYLDVSVLLIKIWELNPIKDVQEESQCVCVFPVFLVNVGDCMVVKRKKH